MRDTIHPTLSELWPADAAHGQVLLGMWDTLTGKKKAGASKAPQKRDHHKTSHASKDTFHYSRKVPSDTSGS